MTFFIPQNHCTLHLIPGKRDQIIIPLNFFLTTLQPLPKGYCFCFLEVIAMPTRLLKGGFILRTFVPESGFGTYAMMAAILT